MSAGPTMRRAYRCALFMPGDERRKIEKGAALGVDAVIMDIEDGTALNRKQAARDTIREALSAVAFGRTAKLVRVNPPESGWTRDDILQTMPGRPDGYVIPKVESAETLQFVSDWVGQLETLHGLSYGTVRLLAMIETARGVLNVAEIAAADPRLDALVLGSEDLASSIGATRSAEGWEIFYARSAVVLAAGAHQLHALDSIYADFNDEQALRADALRALGMGFAGKCAIHPRQVTPLQEIFTPTAEAVARAQRLIEAFAAQQEAGAGAFTFEGKMVDMPMLRSAERLLARVPPAPSRT